MPGPFTWRTLCYLASELQEHDVGANESTFGVLKCSRYRANGDEAETAIQRTSVRIGWHLCVCVTAKPTSRVWAMT